MLDIVINGKFLAASLEGMPRVGREITAAFDRLLGEAEFADVRVEVLCPRGAAATIALANIPVREVGSRKGVLWEQVEFAIAAGRRYTLNFTGTAPILRRHGCVVVHDAQFRSSASSHGWKSALMYGVITPIVARRYRTVTTGSHYALQEIAQYRVSSRKDIAVIPHAADHVLRRPQDDGILARAQLEAGSYMLSNSYSHTHKNVQILFEALRRSTQPDLRLAMFGRDLRGAYEGKGISVPDNVLFLGRVSDGELTTLIRNARIFLFPSKTEGFGLPPLEAMMLGTPTICARAGAMPEVCGDGALYADPDDAAAWKDAIEALWCDAGKQRLMASAGQRQASRYSWMESARSYLRRIQQATGAARRG